MSGENNRVSSVLKEKVEQQDSDAVNEAETLLAKDKKERLGSCAEAMKVLLDRYNCSFVHGIECDGAKVTPFFTLKANDNRR